MPNRVGAAACSCGHGAPPPTSLTVPYRVGATRIVNQFNKEMRYLAQLRALLRERPT